MRSLRPAMLVIVAFALLTGCAHKNASQPDATAVVAQSSAVHPCLDATTDPFNVQASRLNGPTATATATPPATSTATAGDAASAGGGAPGCEAPDFSQRCVLWGSDQYDHGNSMDIGCGKTIAQCGCAMTSAASLLVRDGVSRGPDGQPTTPKTLNAYFQQDTHQTNAGLVSQGYVYGSVNWLAVAAYAKQAAASFGTPEVTYAGNLAADLAGLQKELDSNRPVILEQPGHFILATKDETNTVAISDPYYADRTSLDVPAYKNRFVSGRLFRPGGDTSALMVAAPRGVKVSVTDASGARTGFKAGQSTPVSEVKQSLFARELAWQDPTCTASPPLADQGVDEAILLQPGAARYGIDVDGAPSSGYSFAVFAYDQAGGLVLQTIDGSLPASGNAHYDIDYDPSPGSAQPITSPSAPPPPTSTPTPLPARPGATATSRPVAPPAATATPEPPTATPPPPPPAGAPTFTPTRTPTRLPSPTRTPTLTPTPSPTPTATPYPVVLHLGADPATVLCYVQGASTSLSVTASTPAGALYRGSATVVLSASVGQFSSASIALTNGTGGTKYFPGAIYQKTDITVTASLTAPFSGPTASVTVSCPDPPIIQ